MTTQSNPTDSQIQQNQLCFQMIKNFSVFLQKGMKFDIETDQKNGQVQKLSSNKKSTIFELSSWNLVKITSQWGGLFDQVSWW